MKKILLIGLLGAVTMGLFACGDNVTKITEVEAAGVPIVVAGDELPSCEDAAKGNMVYVEDSLAVYYCSGKEWLPVKGENGSSGEDGESCTVKETASGYDVYCGDKKVGELSNGADGIPGSAGSKGDDGESCTVKETSTGYDVYCGDKKVGELSNGADGVPGSAGSKGDGCTLTDNGDGSITQKCGEEEVTLYKALCGTAPYDPAGDKFCYGVTLYDKCGGKDYNPAKQFCLDGALTELCGGKSYTADEFCLNNEVVAKCDGKTFEENEFCQGSAIKEKCGGKAYTVDQFCSGATVYDKCNDGEYDPSAQTCSNNIVLTTEVACPSGETCVRAPTSQLNTGVAYGEMLDSRDNQIYKTVVIGNQVWLAQNLNYEVNDMVQSWCYDNDKSFCSTYGRLYTWAAAVGKTEEECGVGKLCNLPDGDIRGVCPEGWHLPRGDEWNTLSKIVDPVGYDFSYSAPELLATSLASGMDLYGFSALPAGILVESWIFAEWNESLLQQNPEYIYTAFTDNASDGRSDVFGAFWWAADEGDAEWDGVYYENGGADNFVIKVEEQRAVMYLISGNIVKDMAVSVRCVKN